MFVCFFHRESSSISLPLAEPRVNLLTNGGLEVSNVSHDDEGIYTCSIQNNNVSVSAVLEVLSEWECLSRSGWRNLQHVQLVSSANVSFFQTGQWSCRPHKLWRCSLEKQPYSLACMLPTPNCTLRSFSGGKMNRRSLSHTLMKSKILKLPITAVKRSGKSCL